VSQCFDGVGMVFLVLVHYVVLPGMRSVYRGLILLIGLVVLKYRRRLCDGAEGL